MAYVENMMFALHGKNEGFKGDDAVLDRLHMVMFMSINPKSKPLMISRHVGGRWWWKILITYNLVLLGQNTFGFTIANSISKRSPFQV
jgi:hypothetical protein